MSDKGWRALAFDILNPSGDVIEFVVDHGKVTLPNGQAVPVPELFCVVYRTGGTANFRWHRTIAMTAREAADALASVTSGGFAAHVERYFASVAIGLPTTFSPDFPDVRDWS